MNPTVRLGTPLVVGLTTPAPLRDFPAGRVRIRLRPRAPVRVFVHPPEGGVRAFLVRAAPDGAWTPTFELARNVVVPVA